MVKHFDVGSALIEQCFKYKDTALLLGLSEQFNNPCFNSPKFKGIDNKAGSNCLFLSVKSGCRVASETTE